MGADTGSIRTSRGMENNMKSNYSSLRTQKESGVALLVAIFVLMLVSVIAISLIIASGGESALEGNYRSSAAAYLAGTAGLEEARGRLLKKNADYFNNTVANFIPTAAPLPIGQVRYILNPGPGEALGTLLATYPDNEYAVEFGAAPVAGNVQTIASVSTVVSAGTTYYGPQFKWVRINAATERSIQTNVDGVPGLDNTAPLFYDPAHLPKSSLIVPPMAGGVPNLVATPSAKQALEITTLAVLPNGTQKILQYVVTPVSFGLNFPSALTMAGAIGTFNGANSNPYHINGQDGSGGGPAVPGCAPNPATILPAIGVTAGNDAAGNLTNQNQVAANLPRPGNYDGAPANPPIAGNVASVSNVGLTTAISTPAALNQLVQTLEQNADAVIPNPLPGPGINNSGTTYNYGGAGWPAGMSAANPQIVVVDGSFDLGPNTGYGLLIVTGNFLYHGNSGWNGIILVIGEGTTTFQGNGGGNGSFNGAIYAATTRDAAGNPLAAFGTTNFDISGGGGNGIYYDSCWVNNVQQPPTYQVLSFRELHF